MKKKPRPEALVKLERTTSERAFIDDPLKALPPSDWVHIMTPEQEINRASNAEIAFWLRLKATPGCLSKRNSTDGTMHLYIEPRSEAAKLFVRRMIPKLGDGHPHVRALLPERHVTVIPRRIDG